jgi:dsDNA-binding SOS-regulon protein
MTSRKKKPASDIDKALQAARLAARVLQNQAPSLSKDELEDLAERVATKVVAQSFKQFGVDIASDKGVEDFRKDMEYTRAWRTTIQKGTRTGLLTAITVATTGFLGIIWIAIRLAFLGHV